MKSNHLLDLLPAAERRRLLAQCELTPLRSGEAVAVAGERARAVMFPVEGHFCLVAALDAHPPLQVATIGCEGCVGAALLMGVSRHPLTALVQQDGQAWGLPVAALRSQLPTSPVLRRLLPRYLMVQLRQVATSAGCLRFHALRERLASWLLRGDDRSAGAGFAVTHQHMADFLGVRRVGVTVAAGQLQGAGLIRYQRGWLTIGNRAGLEQAACSCYAQDRASYDECMLLSPRLEAA